MVQTRTGVLTQILEQTFVTTAKIACTPITILGNALTLEITVATSGFTGLTLTAERSLIGGLAYGEILSGDTTWSMSLPQIDSPGVYIVTVPIPLAVKDVLKLSVTPDVGGGHVTIKALSYEDPAGGGFSSTTSSSSGSSPSQAETIHLINEPNKVAGTYHKQFLMGTAQSMSFSFEVSGGVVCTVWATNDSAAVESSDTGWINISQHILGKDTIEDEDFMAFADTKMIVTKLKVKYVCSDSTNAVSVWVRKAY